MELSGTPLPEDGDSADAAWLAAKPEERGAAAAARLERLQRRAEARVWNGGVLAAVALGASVCLLYNDVSAIASMYATPDWALPAGLDPASRLEISRDLLLRLPSDWLLWYDDEALARPVLVKAATSGVCYFVGDLIAQRSTGATLTSLDLPRSTRSAAAGFIGHGPVAHYWLNYVDESMSFGGAWWAFFPRIIADQGPMALVYNSVYTALIGAFALRPPSAVVAEVRQNLVPSMLASIRFWPFVHLVTFSPLVPLELKLLWIDAVEIVWVTILSRINAREAPSEPHADAVRGATEAA